MNRYIQHIIQYIKITFLENKDQKLVSVEECTSAGESEISRNRFILVSLVLSLSYFYLSDPIIIILTFFYLCFATALWISQVKDIIPSHIRLTLGLLLEASMGFYLLSIDSEKLAFIYPIYLWTILGNGFRFGIKWLFIASLFVVISFAATIYTEPFWQKHLALSIGLLLALIIIPAYCASLIKKLSQAKEKAEAANSAKSYFLASVSHELRTPLNAIIGYGTHLSGMNLNPSQHKMVASSVSAGQYLLQLIEQLLKLGRSETQADEIEIAEFNITDLMVETRDILHVRASEKGLQLLLQSETNCQSQYVGPAKEIKNLLLNITGNAIKFTECGKIIIRSSINQVNKKPILELSIADTGIGIKDEAYNKIFEPFQQADDTILNRFGGTGLGLAICKQTIEKLGGKISVISEIGIGSTFKLSIPLSSAKNIEARDEEDIDLQSTTNIISLGRSKQDTLLQAQCSAKYFISHYECSSIKCIQETINTIELHGFDIAILDQSIVGEIDSQDQFWKQFQQASLACIIVSEDEDIDIHKMSIQAAFASILPPTPDFNCFRQAMNIGASFLEPILENPELNYGDIKDNEHISDSSDNIGELLVVDDNRTNRLVLETILSSAGYNVTEAQDGDEALEQLEQSKYDLMLIDVNMPKLNGIEATRIWRNTESTSNRMPIIGVTADATKETQDMCISAGMDERLTKPVEAKNLIGKLQSYLGNKDIKTDNITKINSEIKTLDTRNSSIDHNRLEYLKSIGGNEFVRLVIDSYVDETHSIQLNLYKDGNTCSLKNFQFTAHAIKSSANNIGATHLSKLCTKYESLIRGDYDLNPQSYIDMLMNELKRVENDILAAKEYYSDNIKNINII